jgi:hypothetical protein
MSSSVDYWNVSETVRDGLCELADHAKEMHEALEANDDPGELAGFLEDIEKEATRLIAQIGPNVSALRKIAKAMDDLPGVKA